MKGKLIVVSAPSGAGKTTIVRRVLQAGLKVAFSVSACSRSPRPGESEGKDYYFMPADVFKRKIENNEFLEWEEVYRGQFYGTLRSEIDRIWSEGYHVIFDVDVKGGLNIKRFYPELTLALFIMPPSVKVLEERLRKRDTESETDIKKRIKKATAEIAFAGQFDRVVINDDLDRAVDETVTLIKDFIKNESKAR